MANYFSHFKFLVLLFALTACEKGLFDEKQTILSGDRINVLHEADQEFLENQKINFDFQEAVNLGSWPTSDVGKANNFPDNLEINPQPKKIDSFYLNFFKTANLASGYIIVEDKIISYQAGTLSAYSLSSKQKLWAKVLFDSRTRSNILDGSLTYFKGLIYVATGSFELAVFSIDNGNEIWRHRLANIARSIPLVDQNNVYILTIDNKLYSFNRFNGTLNWNNDGTSFSLHPTKNYQPFIEFEDKLVVATSSGELLIINKLSGEVLGNFNYTFESIIGDGNIAKQPISSLNLINNSIIFLSGEETLVNFSLKNFSFNWIKKIHGAKSIWTIKNISFILTHDNIMLAIDNQSGRKIWFNDLNKSLNLKKSGKLYGPILAADNLLIFSETGNFWQISSEDGKTKQRFNDNFPLAQIPYIVDKKLYFFGTNGKVNIWN